MKYQNNDKIKIFVSMHDQFYLPEHSLLEPIQVGASLADNRFDNMLYDDEGDNISSKNKMYCELTAQYWVWKNMPDLDYYGFFHYRRYLSFNPIQLEHWENIVYFDYCNREAIEKIMLNEEVMRNLITSYDVIYPQENPIGGDTIYEHWCKHLEKKDIDLLIQVVIEKYPDYYELARDVLNSKQAIHCNMFIMKKEYFEKYNEWLFDILKECEKRIDFSNYSTEKLRTIGHMAERLCAIYCKYLEKQGAKICYLQRVQFRNNEPNRVINIYDNEMQIPIVLSCDNGYVKYTSVLIESIMRNANLKYNYQIYILHKDITEENMHILEDQVSTKDNVFVYFIDIRRKMAEYKSLFVDRHLSIETYFRFLILELFPNLSKILYLDCDVIVEKDIAELFHTNVGNYSLAATRDVDIISLYPKEDTTDPEVRDNIDNNLRLECYENYFQAGVLLFNLKRIRQKYRSEDLFSIATQRRWKFQDQDVLNYVFSNDVLYLDINWNTLYECFNRGERVEKYTSTGLSKQYKEAKRKPWIIHYAGTPKPWDNMEVDMAHYFWKYAKTSPFFEILIHEMNIKKFNELKNNIDNGNIRESDYKNVLSQRDELQCHVNEIISQRDELQYHLNEIYKSFSYKLGMKMTALPRKLREIRRGN